MGSGFINDLFDYRYIKKHKKSIYLVDHCGRSVSGLCYMGDAEQIIQELSRTCNLLEAEFSKELLYNRQDTYPTDEWMYNTDLWCEINTSNFEIYWLYKKFI